MITLFIAYIAVIPLFAGMFVRKILEFRGRNLADDYISGVLSLIVMSGIVQFTAIKLNYSFSWYCRIMLVASVFMALVGAVLSVALQTFTLSSFKQGVKDKVRAVARRNNIWWLVLVGTIFLLVLARITLSEPVLEGDFTLETLNTTITTDSIYRYNSLTGQLIENGMPIRQQILTLPVLLAFFADIFEVDAALLVFRIWPCLVAFMCFLVYHRIANYLLPDEFEKRLMFINLFAFMMLVGDCGVMSPTFLLVYKGFSGYSLLANVILPFLLASLVRKQWGQAALCLAAEVFVVWTTYGFGFGIIMTVFYLICMVIYAVFFDKKRRNKEVTGKA